MKVTIEPYNPQWPWEFEKESAILMAAIGDSYLVIEHIGSTAVDGLGAKPIIDMMIGVKSISNVQKHVTAIQQLGYKYYPEFETEMPFRRFFSKSNNKIKTHQIHLVETGSEFWDRHLLFRNHLRQHPSDKKLYQEFKESLAQQEWADINDYAAAKTGFIRRMEKKARGYR